MHTAPQHHGRYFLTVILLGLLFSSQTQALTFDLGLSFSQPVVDVRNNQATGVTADPKDELLSQNASKTAIWPYLSLQSRERYIGNSNWGYSLSGMFWYFSTDKQKVKEGKDTLTNYNTSIDGYYAYLTPTFYYRWGDKHIMESTDTWNVTLGVGIGVGYLSASGNTYTNYSATPTTEKIEVDNAAISSGFFLEVVKDRWFARFTSYGPSSATTYSKYNVRLNDNSVIFGRRFDWDEVFN